MPLPLAHLSPWLDWVITPREDVHSLLDAQQHRRIIKTHTPLDGLSIDTRVTYIVVAHHPLDAAVSLYCQGANLDRARFERMQAHADHFVPDPAGVLNDPTQFFRRGTSGAGQEVLTPSEVAHDELRTAQLAPADLLGWLHADPDHLRGR